MATRRYINGDVDFEEILSMRPRDRRARSKRIANGLLRRWRGMARALPARYRNAYLRSMQVDVSSDGTEVMLSLEPSPEDNTLVKSVEYGFGPGGVGTYGPYDMRKTLLKPTTKSIRYNKQGGMYLNVPMRMTTRAMRAMRGVGTRRRRRRGRAEKSQVRVVRWVFTL